MKRILPIVFTALLLAAFVAWWFSPAQVVKRRTASLLETVSLEKDSAPAARHLKTYALNARLASEVLLDAPAIEEANGRFGRPDLESGFSWMCAHAKEAAFKVERYHSVTVDGDRANVSLTLDGLVELRNYRPVDGRYDVEFDWKREEDGWRLTGASWREAE